MSQKANSRGIIGVFLMILFLFFVFIAFAVFIMNNLKIVDFKESGSDLKNENAPIVVIEVEGIILSSKKYIELLHQAEEDESVKAIVLRIDSPGGSATASDIIWREVVAARAKKPVIASVSDVAASGGYYISMAADTIVAHPNSIVGSIGVFAGKFSTGKFFEKIGIATETLKRGRNADFFTSESRFSPEQRDILRGYIMETYNDFISKAGQGRGKTAEEIDRIARGRVWTGEQALGIGLVDVLGDFSEAIAIAKEKIGLSRDTLVPLEIYPHKRGLLERIRSGQLSLAEKQWEQTLNQLPLPLRKAVGAIPHFNPGEALYLAPVDFWNVSQAAF